MKLLEGNIGENLHGIGFGNDCGCDTKNIGNKSKIRQVSLHQIKNFLPNKGNNCQSKMATH